MSRFIWCVKQLLPLTYWTVYTNEAGEKQFAIWRMWFGRCFDAVDIPAEARLAVNVDSPVGENSQQEKDHQTARALRKELRQVSASH